MRKSMGSYRFGPPGSIIEWLGPQRWSPPPAWTQVKAKTLTR
jgi:hypothetical protein